MITLLLNTLSSFSILNPSKKTESIIPPKSIDKKVCFGTYCMRTTVHLEDSNNGILYTYNGYSDDMNIIYETENACIRKKNEKQKCSEPSIMFIKDVPNCNGLITETNRNNNDIKIITYGGKK